MTDQKLLEIRATGAEFLETQIERITEESQYSGNQETSFSDQGQKILCDEDQKPRSSSQSLENNLPVSSVGQFTDATGKKIKFYSRTSDKKKSTKSKFNSAKSNYVICHLHWIAQRNC